MDINIKGKERNKKEEYERINITSFLFPFLELYRAERAVNDKIRKLRKPGVYGEYKNEYVQEHETLDEKVLVQILKDTLNAKIILEDKAKTSLIAITLAASFIFNVINFMQENNISTFYFYLIYSVSILCLLLMIIAGVFSLYVLAEINTVSKLFPNDYKTQETHKKKERLTACIELNYLYNLKRNNLMNTSYKCMILSISLLVLIFALSIFPNQSLKSEIENLTNKYETFSQSSKVIETNIGNLEKDYINLEVANQNIKEILTKQETIIQLQEKELALVKQEIANLKNEISQISQTAK